MNDNNDNIDEIEFLLKNGKIPQADKSAKNRAFDAALKEFAEKNIKNEKSLQGNASASRLIKATVAVKQFLRGENNMKKIYLIASGVCASALAVTLMNSTYLSKDLLPQKVAYEDANGRRVEALAIGGVVQEQTNTSGSNAPVAETDKEARPEVAALQPPPPAASLQEVLKAVKEDKSSRAIAERSKGKAEMVADSAIAGYSVVMESNRIAASPPFPGIAPIPSDNIAPYYQDEGRDKFDKIKQNPLKVTAEEPVSTFSIDVDTSAYSFVRSAINGGRIPPKDAVRIEEMINYFPYQYAAPKDKSEPFAVYSSLFPTPWNNDTKLLHIAIKGYDIEQKEKPHSNLVFLIDTSGSMNAPNKLPLLINSFKLLLDSLKDDDSVAIVTYAGSAGIALEPTLVKDKQKIIASLERLTAGGSTAGAQGIKTAYDLAKQHFNKNGVNRVLLATDGDFNVGITSQDELKSYIEKERTSGVFLSILGFGVGNFNDALMQTLAQNGNGNAAYIDSLSEARKVLVEEASSTLFAIAGDVKIQVEFNPATVAEYRLIGYENRMLNREDFNNDKVDAGDIGSGHSVTAIYELTPVGSKARMIDESRYAEKKEAEKKASNEYGFVKLRYKLPGHDKSELIASAVDAKAEYKTLDAVPQEAKFATSVAAFAQILRGDFYTGNYSYDDVIKLAESAKGEDKFGYRSEFLNIVRLAKSLQAVNSGSPAKD